MTVADDVAWSSPRTVNKRNRSVRYLKRELIRMIRRLPEECSPQRGDEPILMSAPLAAARVPRTRGDEPRFENMSPSND